MCITSPWRFCALSAGILLLMCMSIAVVQPHSSTRAVATCMRILWALRDHRRLLSVKLSIFLMQIFRDATRLGHNDEKLLVNNVFSQFNTSLLWTLGYRLKMFVLDYTTTLSTQIARTRSYLTGVIKIGLQTHTQFSSGFQMRQNRSGAILTSSKSV